MSLKGAFNSLLRLHGRDVTYFRPGETEVTVRVSPSNYGRILQVSSDMIVEGREFILTVDEFAKTGFDKPKRGDRFVDAELGDFVFSDIRELFDLGGQILGYRIRTS